MQINITKHSITITSNVYASIIELQNELIKWEADNIQVLKEHFPKDYEYVIHVEKCGLFLANGSPQIHELGWSMIYEVSSNSSSLSFSNMEKY